MKILMTGHRGVIGGLVTPHLKHEIIGYDLLDGEDILDTKLLAEKLKGVDACVHLAGIPRPLEIPYSEYEKTNILGTLSVIKACKMAKTKKLVYMSSCAVYGVTQNEIKPTEFPLRERDARSPEELESYAKSKRICEEHVIDYGGVCLRIDTPLPVAEPRPSHLFATVTPENLAKGIDCALKTIYSASFNIVDPDCVEPKERGEVVDINTWLATNYPGIPNKVKPGKSLYSLELSKKIGYA